MVHSFLYVKYLYAKILLRYLDVKLVAPKGYNGGVHEDDVDRILRQWAEQRPDLDASPMGVFGRLSRANRLLGWSLEENFERFGLRGGGFDVLAALRRVGEPYSLTPTELFRSMMLSSAAMTNRIDRLEGRGLVRRSPDPDDRRGVLITLTDEGLALVEEAVRAHVENEKKLLEALDPGERDQLADLLRKLLASMEGAREGVAGPPATSVGHGNPRRRHDAAVAPSDAGRA